MKNKRIAITSYFVILMGCYSSILVADDFSFHGFASQGLTQSINSDFITNENKVTLDLSEFGINGRFKIAPRINLVGQVVYLNGGNRFDEGLRLDYLFLDASLPTINNWSLNAHIGRYKNRHWLYSSTRDVPQTRHTTILPQSVYYDALRDVALSSDGLDISALKFSEQGKWQINWSYGQGGVSNEQTKQLAIPTASGEVFQDYVHQWSVYWQPPSLNWKLGASYLGSKFRYTPSKEDYIVFGLNDIKRYTMTIEYLAENWQISSELVQEDFFAKASFADDSSYYSSRVGQGGYIQWRYFVSPSISILLMYDTYVVDKSDRQGVQLEASSGGLVPSYYGYMDTVTIGASWQITEQWRFNSEYSYIHGAGRLDNFFIPGFLPNTEEYWKMWSLQIMYNF